MATRPKQAQIENAFLPAREIDDATRFAGRNQQVQTVHQALMAQGTNIAIVGNRGIGKSSLARQLVAMASGKTELLDRLGLKYDDKHDFLTVYFACGSQTQSLDHLLQQLLTNDECLSRWAYYVPQAMKEIEASPKLNLGFVKVDVTANVTSEAKAAVTQHDLQTVFTNVVNAIAKQNLAKNGVLIVVDEFDQLAHTRWVRLVPEVLGNQRALGPILHRRRRSRLAGADEAARVRGSTLRGRDHSLAAHVEGRADRDRVVRRAVHQ